MPQGSNVPGGNPAGSVVASVEGVTSTVVVQGTLQPVVTEPGGNVVMVDPTTNVAVNMDEGRGAEREGRWERRE